MKTLLLTIIGVLFFLSPVFAQNSDESNAADDKEARKYWSLFSEYHKNKDFKSSIPFGRWLVANKPDQYKTLWKKLSESYEEVGKEQEDFALKTAYFDSSMTILDFGVQYQPGRAKSYLLTKAYNYEAYLEQSDSAIANYLRCFNMGLDEIDYRYIIRAGYLMATNDRVAEAIELYTESKDYFDSVSNVDAADAMRNELTAIASPEELLAVNNKSLEIETDPVKKEKLLWQNYQIYDQQLKDDQMALQSALAIQKLNPEARVYRAVGKSQFNLGKYSDAIESYKKASEVEEAKEDYINIAQSYISLENGASARFYARKALAVDNSMGRAYILIGQSYEAAVAKCVMQKGGWSKLEFDDKIVYVLAVSVYNTAKRIDPSITSEANNRINAIQSLMPSRQDYFFKQLKSGQTIQVNSGCYDWINETVTVPAF